MSGRGADGRFKAIIVGAGVSGLTLAHAFDKAGIDYVVLDKRPVAPAWGASISIFPNGSRLLDQLGLYDLMNTKHTEMQYFHCRGSDGKTYCSAPFLKEVSDSAGYMGMTIERRIFLQTLYDELPDKSKAVEHARVSEIIEDQNRVKVVLADGIVHEGDIVIGCDGAHSAVREIMWERAHRLSPGLITADEKQKMKATYTCLIGIAPYQNGLGSNILSTVSNDKFSFLFLTQPEKIFFIVPIKMKDGQMSQYSNRMRFTDEDVETQANKLLDYRISDTLVFGDIWKTRIRGQLVSLEEGILSQWSFGRIVLCGDATHKVTPNAGLEGNMAMESSAVLANELVAAVNLHPNKKPSDEEIRLAFKKYHEIRTPRVKELFDISWMLTRLQAYDGWRFYIIQRCLLPFIFMQVAKQIATAMSGAPVLSFVPFSQRSGKVEWKKQAWELEKKIKSQSGSGITSSNGLIASIASTALLAYTATVWYFGRALRDPVTTA
ncbi:FAD dependent oxidoreductase domain-containing protein [Stachybotrys elegans]|uniref:FAD dependent oxidoreductase domain-containing protein n=1 Tax=Stachybotrys elegans TaxID=80388 RepID=A0A8K0SNP4_9HYPO|nr:FAD dependent oxidoreductase domain-containing protein [Stachybotrys elegans]